MIRQWPESPRCTRLVGRCRRSSQVGCRTGFALFFSLQECSCHPEASPSAGLGDRPLYVVPVRATDKRHITLCSHPRTPGCPALPVTPRRCHPVLAALRRHMPALGRPYGCRNHCSTMDGVWPCCERSDTVQEKRIPFFKSV